MPATRPPRPALPRRRFLLAAAVAGCGVSGLARAGAATFALTPPDRASALRDAADSEAARSVVAQARSALARPTHVMPLVRTSGLLDGEGVRNASIEAQEDWRQVRLQALAWRLTGNRTHADCALRYLHAWIGPAGDRYTPSFNPIDETELAALMWGVDLLQEAMPAALRDGVRGWCGPLAQGYLAPKIINGGPSTGINNWHSHRMKLGTAAAFMHGSAALTGQAQDQFILQVLRNIDRDGKAFDFTQRDALHYVVFTLEPLLACASMAAAHGMDWYRLAAIDGRLEQALRWLLPYAMGERTHEEFVGSSVDFDRRRAQAGVKGYSGIWQRQRAATVYWLAARLDSRFRPISAALPAPPLVQLLHAHTFPQPPDRDRP